MPVVLALTWKVEARGPKVQGYFWLHRIKTKTEIYEICLKAKQNKIKQYYFMSTYCDPVTLHWQYDLNLIAEMNIRLIYK